MLSAPLDAVDCDPDAVEVVPVLDARVVVADVVAAVGKVVTVAAVVSDALTLKV